MHGRILEGKNIRLRPLVASDIAGIEAALLDEESMRLTGTQQTFTRAQLEAHVERIGKDPTRYDYSITLREDPFSQYIGEVVLNQIDSANSVAGFRIALGSAERFGKGFGSQATYLILGFAFEDLGLHRVELEVYSFNPRAIRTYEKLGFVREGVRRECLDWQGQKVDAISMGILKHEWPAIKEKLKELGG